MDFWDLLKTLWNRRAVTVPLLTLTAIAGAYVGFTTQPDHRATGQVSLVAPTIRTGNPVNPWDVQTMAGILSVQLHGNSTVQDRLRAEGLVGEYGVTVERSLDQPLPIIKVDATASDAPTAQTMVKKIIEIATESLAAQQAPARLRSGEQIRLVPVAPEGGSVTEVRTTVVRSLVVVVLAGLILTAGVAIAIDAIARRRAGGTNQNDERLAQPRGRVAGLPSPLVTQPPPPYIPVVAHQQAASAGPPLSRAPQSAQPAHNEPIHQSRPASTAPRPSGYATGAPADATIVLPLTGMRPARGGQGDQGDQADGH